MKKLILLTTLASLASASAFAKTEGNQIGIDILRASAKHRYKAGSITASNYSQFDDSSIGVGVNYKYAINFENIFIAPGAFYEKIGTKSKDSDGDTVSVNNRYGAKLDIGYDLTNNFAAYLSTGYALIDGKVDWKSLGQKKSDRQGGIFYGVGLAYSATKNVVLGLEYNVQSVDLKTPNDGGINKAKTDLGVMKFGVAYRF